MNSPQELQKLKGILAKQRNSLLALPNVIGVGIGTKRVGNQNTGELALLVLVEKKVPAAQLTAEALVPQTLEGFKTDVVEIGRVTPLNRLATATPLPPSSASGVAPGTEEGNPPTFEDIELEARRRKWRPARPGVSLGHYLITAGTLGAVVLDKRTGKPLILSNNHVVANSTSGRDQRARRGDPVYQPGPYDGGTEADCLGRLYRFVNLKFLRNKFVAVSALTTTSATNFVDAGLVKPNSPTDLDPYIWGVGLPQGTTEAVLGMKVQKSGRTTGLTQGTVEVLHMSVQVDYGEGRVATFDEQIGCSAMSQGGDSGSLVLDEERQAVGLLFAGSPTVTICSPIQKVCELLEIEIPDWKS